MSDPKHNPECLWCGHRIGAELRVKCAFISSEARYECGDRKACDERITAAIKKAEIVGPGGPR